MWSPSKCLSTVNLWLKQCLTCAYIPFSQSPPRCTLLQLWRNVHSHLSASSATCARRRLSPSQPSWIMLRKYMCLSCKDTSATFVGALNSAKRWLRTFQDSLSSSTAHPGCMFPQKSPCEHYKVLCRYGHMIDNIVLIVSGTLHERDVQELLDKCHPLGMFDR